MARLWLAILVAMAVFLPAFADDEDRGSQGASCPASVLNPRQLCPCNVQPPAGIPRGVDVVSLFLNNLTAATQWDLVKSIKLNVPDIYHPQVIWCHCECTSSATTWWGRTAGIAGRTRFARLYDAIHTRGGHDIEDMADM